MANTTILYNFPGVINNSTSDSSTVSTDIMSNILSSSTETGATNVFKYSIYLPAYDTLKNGTGTFQSPKIYTMSVQDDSQATNYNGINITNGDNIETISVNNIDFDKSEFIIKINIKNASSRTTPVTIFLSEKNGVVSFINKPKAFPISYSWVEKYVSAYTSKSMTGSNEVTIDYDTSNNNFDIIYDDTYTGRFITIMRINLNLIGSASNVYYPNRNNSPILYEYNRLFRTIIDCKMHIPDKYFVSLLYNGAYKANTTFESGTSAPYGCIKLDDDDEYVDNQSSNSTSNNKISPDKVANSTIKTTLSNAKKMVINNMLPTVYSNTTAEKHPLPQIEISVYPISVTKTSTDNNCKKTIEENELSTLFNTADDIASGSLSDDDDTSYVTVGKMDTSVTFDDSWYFDSDSSDS